jgi:putative ABC transport system permease protein
MALLGELGRRLRMLLHRRRFERDLADEMRLHLELRQRERVADGLAPAIARQAALRRFGNPTRLHEISREMWGWGALERLLQDVRFGLRLVARSPAASLGVVLILALGIGSGTALFSIVDGAFLHPFAYRDAHRFVVLNQDFPRQEIKSWFFSLPEYLDLRSRAHAFQDLVAQHELTVNLATRDRPERLYASEVSANTFPLIGVPPLIGRTFLPEEDGPGAPRVVLIGYDLWHRRFGADPRILRRTIALDGESYTVVGVMPYRFRMWGGELWFPLRLNAPDARGAPGASSAGGAAAPPGGASRPDRDGLSDRGRRWLKLGGYLRPGVSMATARADLRALARQLEREQRGAHPEAAGLKLEAILVRDVLIGDLRPALFVLLGAVVLLLLITGADVASLLLTRFSARAKEMAVRGTLGASPLRLARQLLTESLVFSMLGAAAGCLLAWGSLPLLLALIPPRYIAAEAEIRINLTAMGVAAGLALLMGLFVGLAPALHTRRPRALDALRGGGRGSGAGSQGGRARDLLVIGQIALALVVMAGAGLMIETYAHLAAVPLGFEPGHVLTLRVGLPEIRYPRADDVLGFYGELLRRLHALPGVTAAAVVSDRPMAELSNQELTIPGREEPGGVAATASVRRISPEYFAAMRIPLRAGRAFGDQDQARGLPVAIVNETMAKRFWPGANPLGRQFAPGRGTAAGTPGAAAAGRRWTTIVGVVGDARQRRSALAEVRPELYLPLAQTAEQARDMAILVRTTGDPTAWTAAVERQVRALDPQQPVYEVLTLREIVARGFGPQRLTAVLLALFAAMSFLLAVSGLYAVLALAVSWKTHDIGIRMALGARATDVRRHFVRHGAVLAAAGIGLGLAATLALTRLMADLLFGVSAGDPVVVAGAALLLTGVAAAASYVPARRASLLDPAVALRSD